VAGYGGDDRDRPEESELNDRQKAQVALARVLLSQIRATKYPSATQMDLLEQMIPRALASEYFEVLLEKVMVEQWPSIPMLARLSRLTATM
jgi:hypothetical protein